MCSRTQKTCYIVAAAAADIQPPRGEPIFYSRGRPCSGENRDSEKNAVIISEIPFAEVTRTFYSGVRRVVSIYYNIYKYPTTQYSIIL